MYTCTYWCVIIDSNNGVMMIIMILCMLSVGGRGMTFEQRACMGTEDMLKLRACMGTGHV